MLKPLILLLGAVAAPLAAHAQDDAYMGQFNHAGRVISDIAGNAAVGQSIKNRTGRSQDDDARPGEADLTFRRYPKVTQLAREEIAAQTRKKSPEAARQFLHDTQHYDIAATLRRAGLSPNTLADAAAYHVGVYWAAVHQRAERPGPGQMQGLRRQMVEVMRRRKPAALTEGVRQSIADELMLRAYSTEQMLRLLARQPDAQQAALVSRAARQQVQRTMGLDLADYDLTSAGLVPRAR